MRPVDSAPCPSHSRGERRIAEVDMAEFIFGLLVGLAAAMISRSYFARLGMPVPLDHIRMQFREALRRSLAKPQAPQVAVTSEVLPLAEPAEPLAIHLRRLESAFLPIADNAAHPREFLDQPSFLEAAALLANEAVSLKTVMQYVFGTNWALSCATLAGIEARPDGAEVKDQVATGFDRLTPWAMHYALNYFLKLPSRPPLGAPFVNAKEWWHGNAVVTMAAREYFEEVDSLGEIPSFGAALDAVPSASYPIIRGFFEVLNHALANELIEQIDVRQRAVVDRTFLSTFGRFWTSGEKLDLLVEPEAWRENLASAEATLSGEMPRSLLASGEPRIGKTSFLRLLAKRLEGDGWTVFEASGADIMAGQQWFGQLEGRIQKAIEELAASKKLIWYIPDILQIALSGTHQGQAASILDQILPAVSSGRLIVWTEASAAGSARLLRMRPQLRNIFEVIRFEPLSKEETLRLAQALAARLRDEESVVIGPGSAETALGPAIS
jgi:ATP-dependent Clp protease ATP-binding subunit ClpC